MAPNGFEIRIRDPQKLPHIALCALAVRHADVGEIDLCFSRGVAVPIDLECQMNEGPRDGNIGRLKRGISVRLPQRLQVRSGKSMLD